MHYDPIKHTLGNIFNRSPFLRKLFYKLLDLLILRAWHVKKELKSLNKSQIFNILDAGSGFGQYTYRMRRMFPKANILAVDIKEKQITDCTLFFKSIGKDKKVRFEVADLTTFTKPDNYQLILTVDVMEHIEEDVQVFRNFHESLTSGGTLLISTPSDQGGSDVHDNDSTSFIEEHVRDGYNIKEIEEKLKSAGFSRIDARYSYGPKGQISWKLSMKYPILLLGVSKVFLILLPFYYLFVFPISAILNCLDVKEKYSNGTGLIVKAYK